MSENRTEPEHPPADPGSHSLFAAIQPEQGLTTALQQLAMAWQTELGLPACCILALPMTGQKIPLPRDFSPPGTEALPQLAWRSFPLSPKPLEQMLAIGIPPESWDTLPSGWLETTVSLAGWTCRFERELRRQKLEALAEYAAGAGHEINNPLGSIIGRTSQLLKDESDPERRRLLETVGAQAYRIRDMIGDTMLFARPPVPVRRPMNIDTALRSVAARLAPAAQEKQQTIDLQLAADVEISADPDQLSIVISELLRNALQAAPEQSLIVVRSRQTGGPAGAGVEFEVRDSGPGFTDIEWEHCFDPFFSGRQAGRGHGFGLPKCWRIVTQHQATIQLRREGSGTVAVVFWPEGNQDNLQE